MNAVRRRRRMSSHIPAQAPISRDASPVMWLAAHLPYSAAAADRPGMLFNRWHLYGGALPPELWLTPCCPPPLFNTLKRQNIFASFTNF